MTDLHDAAPSSGTELPRASLLDPALQASLDRDGFVVTPFLDATQVQEARDLFTRLGDPPASGFQTDFERPDPHRKQLIHDELSNRWHAPLDELLDDHRPFMSTFLAKWPGHGSNLYLHQDWCYVDERRFRSVVVWVALDDIDVERGNGPLQVLPGSHRVAGQYRGTRTASWYSEHHEAVMAALVPVSVRAGDAVVMDNALVHASPDNTTQGLRLAAALACIPSEAALLHPVGRGDGTVDRLEVDDEFFRDETPSQLRANVPSAWASTAEVVPETWRPPDLRLASRLCGVDLTEPAAEEPLGGSAPPPITGSPVARVANRVLGANHLAITARSIQQGPFLDPAAFPWIPLLEASWATIAEEYRGACRDGTAEAPLPALAGAELPNVGAWRALLLCDHDGWSEDAIARCPATIALLRGVPGIRSAMFSTLGPWARIEAHRGPNKGVLRAHLGVVVPTPHDRVTMWAGREQVSWREGSAFVFDDTYQHRVANRTDGWRVSLMVEFDRPLTGGTRFLNRIVQRGFRFHPHVRGARDRRLAIQHALEA